MTEILGLMGEYAFEKHDDELVITADKYEYGKLSYIITWLLQQGSFPCCFSVEEFISVHS